MISKCTCYYFDEIIKIKVFEIDNILINEESYESFLVYNISPKCLIAKPLHIRFDKKDDLLQFMMKLDI